MASEVFAGRVRAPKSYITVIPQSVDVSVWWLQTPQVKWPSGLWWFTDQPELHRLRFRALILRYKRQDTMRVRVDLVYPIEVMPFNLNERGKEALHKALSTAIERALPDLSVTNWPSTLLDLEVGDHDSV